MKSHIALASLVSSSCLVLSSWFAFAVPTIRDVKVTPVAPWGLAIDYTVSGAVADDASLPLSVTATGGGKTYEAMNLTGDTRWVNGAHRVYWNLAKDGVTATIANGAVSVSLPTYCVIDLSAGADAASYPVSYLVAEPSGGFNTTEYKTTKLVLKFVAAGSFIMDDNQAEESHRVTLTKPLYMGLFEVTQKQWQLVTGYKPSKFTGDARPVECVSYDNIRGVSQGAKWPATNSVDVSGFPLSFLGRLRARTGIDFDLPTEAQWEYVCRAGTTTAFSYGDEADGTYMWYSENSDAQTHEVGTRNPNPWGFYDMHGNVAEWCLDWYGDLQYGMDPKGSSTGSRRVLRGGKRDADAVYCISSCRSSFGSAGIGNSLGLRLVWTLPD